MVAAVLPTIGVRIKLGATRGIIEDEPKILEKMGFLPFKHIKTMEFIKTWAYGKFLLGDDLRLHFEFGKSSIFDPASDEVLKFRSLMEI